MNNEKKLISVVVPVYNEEKNISKFYNDFLNFSKNLLYNINFEIIFIDDGSYDQTLEKIKEITTRDKNVKVVSFTKNEGINTTFSAGLDFASGDCMIFLDVDGQYPISIIDAFYEKWIKNNKIVFARRINYKQNIIIKFITFLFIKFINFFSKINLDSDSSYVCLIDRKVINILKKMNETSKYYPGLIRWTGFYVTFVDCIIEPRAIGKSKASINKKFSEAISAITDFTVAPLRLWTIVGLFVSIVSMLYGFYVLFISFISGIQVPGYLSLFLGIVFMGGLQLISLGFLSEYVTKIYIEGKKRPSYIIKEKKGLK